MKRLGLLGAAAISGLLLAAALPLGERPFLIWIALVPVIVLARGQGFLWGFLAGLGVVFSFAGVALSGALYAVKAPGGEPAWIFTGAGLFGVPVAISLAVWAEPATARFRAFWFAALAVLLEAMLLLQLPAHLALALYRTDAFLWLASVGGIWLVSFLVWWANFAVADLWANRQIPKAAVLYAGAVAMGLIALPSSSAGPKATVAALQIDTTELEGLKRAHESGSQQLAVWPEFGGIAFTEAERLAFGRANSFVTSFSAPGDQALPYNVASLFGPEGESKRYAKRKPFGQETKMHAAGREAVAVPWQGHQLGLNICFDSCFPHVIRETAKLPGVVLIALPTIDPVAPHGFLAAMHAAFTPFRAAETGVGIVRADGFAYSQIVGPDGTILGELRPDQAVLRGEVPLENRTTLAERIGDLWLWACGLLLFVGLRFRNPAPESP